MVLIFRILAVALAAVAFYFYWVRHSDGLFASIVLACVSFFLSIRTEVKKRNEERESAVTNERDENAAAEN